MKNVTDMPKAVKVAIRAVLTARREWERITRIDEATHAEILRDNMFVEEESGTRILNQSADYLMEDVAFAEYCKLVYVRNCEKGIDSGGETLNFWPLKKAVYDAEDTLIETIASDIPVYNQQLIQAIKSSPQRRKEFLTILGL